MNTINTYYGGRVRTRVMGLCFKGEDLLLVKHNMGVKVLYAPPGGGVEVGERLEKALIREFREETNLKVVPGKMLFVTEYIKPPLHAVEIFYELKSWDGLLKTGSEPEIKNENIILDVDFYSIEKIKSISTENLHHILHNRNNLRDLLLLSGHVAPP